MSRATWKFPDQESGLTDYHSIPTEKALDSDLETFVREVLQNANDQGLPNDDPVRVTFEFTNIREEIDAFLESLQWQTGEETSSLGWHVQRATENEQARDPGLRRFLDHFEDDRILHLAIQDENTTGLVGSEDDSSNPYGALVKDFGGSQKLDSSSGGSHGVGKTVLWAFSGLSTVLFNSAPSDELTNGETPPRLVGRSILPAHDHQDEYKTYTNHGWFGLDDTDAIDRLGRPPSLWNGSADSLAEDLHVARENGRPGTTIGVLGFRIPGEDMDPDPEELASEFCHAAVKHFWPAMSRGELEVYVRTPAGGERQATWDDAPAVKPFVECYGELFDVETGVLDGPGSTAKTDVQLTVPKENEEVVDTPDPEFETECDLLVRQLTPGDVEAFDESSDPDLAPNKIARIRGAQMIVDYVDMSSVADRSSDFVGILVCGEARCPDDREPRPAERAAEKFLKRAEPAQHDEWRGSKNDYLKKHYTGTIVGEISALGGERLEHALAELVLDEVESGDDVPGMDDVAPVMKGRKTESEGAGSAMEWDQHPDTWFDDGRWHFYGQGGPADDDHGEWRVSLELKRLNVDESTSDSVPIESVMTDHGKLKMSPTRDGVELVLSAAEDAVEFEGDSKRVTARDFDVGEAFQVGAITETRLDVTAEIETGGDD